MLFFLPGVFVVFIKEMKFIAMQFSVKGGSLVACKLSLSSQTLCNQKLFRLNSDKLTISLLSVQQWAQFNCIHPAMFSALLN